MSQNLNFGPLEWVLTDSILDGIQENGIESLSDFFNFANEKIAESHVNTISKTALYIATAMAKTSYDYWINVVNTPAGWATYLNTNTAINYANIPNWVSATFIGSLSGYAQVQAPNIKDAGILNGQGRNYALAASAWGALGVTCGRVIFKWAKKPVSN